MTLTSFICSKKLIAVLCLIWLGIMCYVWFPSLFSFSTLYRQHKGVSDKEVFDAKAAQHVQFNTSSIAKEDIVHVCITSDENTIGGMIALINSIDQNTKHPVMYHLVLDDKSVDHVRLWVEKSRLRDIMFEIRPFPEQWVEGKIKIRGSRLELGKPLNYARYYLPKLFPDLTGRIVFIDDDCIVQGDVHDLVHMELKPNTWASFAQDCTGSAKRVTMMKNVYADYIDFKNKHIQSLDLNPTECAFNTGVYVTDLELWRKYNITEQLEYWLVLNTQEEVYGNEKGGGGSQPPMMIVFYNKYTPMDPNWHVRYLGWTRGSSYTAAFLKQAKLLHWNGMFKPWSRSSQHSRIWDDYFIKDPLNKFVPIRRN